MSDFVSGFWNVFVVGLTLVSIIGAFLFLSILTLREATAHLEGEWESAHSLLNVASGLLLMAFFFIVALRFAEFVM